MILKSSQDVEGDQEVILPTILKELEEKVQKVV
jgi:hypothetical protein